MTVRYRAWIKTEKRMFFSDDILNIDYENKEIVTQQIYFKNGLPDDRDIYFYDFDEIVLMQSTGLFDENGVEIFEGDIVRQVRTQPTTENETITGVVTMIEGAWLIMNDNEQLASDLWSETDENEIIGNIYENPKLLEVEE